MGASVFEAGLVVNDILRGGKTVLWLGWSVNGHEDGWVNGVVEFDEEDGASSGNDFTEKLANPMCSDEGGMSMFKNVARAYNWPNIAEGFV